MIKFFYLIFLVSNFVFSKEQNRKIASSHPHRFHKLTMTNGESFQRFGCVLEYDRLYCWGYHGSLSYFSGRNVYKEETKTYKDRNGIRQKRVIKVRQPGAVTPYLKIMDKGKTDPNTFFLASEVTDIAAGESAGCAIKNGGLWCFGELEVLITIVQN